MTRTPARVDPHTTYPVIDLMEDQDLGNLGGTMRLGKYRCLLTPRYDQRKSVWNQ